MADDVGSLLLRAGLVDPDQLRRARATVEERGGTVPEELVRSGHVGDEDLTSFYRSRLLIPRVNPSELTRLSAGLLERVPADMAAEFRSVPVALDKDGNLTLIMSDPSDTKAAEEISFFTGSYVMRAVATQAQIAWCLAHYYKQETGLYRDLVDEGVWPVADPGPEPPAELADPSQSTAPMKTRPRPLKKKRSKTSKEATSSESGSSDSDEEEETTGPLKTRVPKRPANQHPSPPELFARAGEILTVAKPERKMDTAPGIQINLDASERVVQVEQRGTDTAPIVLSAIKQATEKSVPIVLDNSHRKRRVSRQTNLGLGAVGSNDSSSPIHRALAEHAESGPQNISEIVADYSDGPSPNITDADFDPDLFAGPTQPDIALAIAEPHEEDDEVTETSPTPVPPADLDGPVSASDLPNLPVEVSFTNSTPVSMPAITKPEVAKPETAAPEAAEADSKDAPRTVDLVGGNWGRPGTTIPPSYLGAQPEAYEDVSDSIPHVIEDDGDAVTSQIHTADSIPVIVPETSDATIRSEAPAAVKQLNLAESASKLLVALRAIDAAEDKRAILDPILTFLDIAYERTGFLALKQDDLSTWLLHGCTDDARSTIGLEEESTFHDVVRTRLSYNGPLEDDVTKRFARDLDIPDAMDLLALPLAIRGRVVGVLFGLGNRDSIFEEHLTVLLQAAGEAFESLLRRRK